MVCELFMIHSQFGGLQQTKNKIFAVKRQFWPYLIHNLGGLYCYLSVGLESLSFHVRDYVCGNLVKLVISQRFKTHFCEWPKL